jgi:hypothetical protein
LPDIEVTPPNGQAARRAERQAKEKLRADAPTMRDARRAVDSFTASLDQAMRGQRL